MYPFFLLYYCKYGSVCVSEQPYFLLFSERELVKLKEACHHPIVYCRPHYRGGGGRSVGFDTRPPFGVLTANKSGR